MGELQTVQRNGVYFKMSGVKEFLQTEIGRQQDMLADQNVDALAAAAADCPNVAASHVEDAKAIVETIAGLVQEHEKEEGDGNQSA